MPILALEIKQFIKVVIAKTTTQKLPQLGSVTSACRYQLRNSQNVKRWPREACWKTGVRSALWKMLRVQFYVQSWEKKKRQEGLKVLHAPILHVLTSICSYRKRTIRWNWDRNQCSWGQCKPMPSKCYVCRARAERPKLIGASSYSPDGEMPTRQYCEYWTLQLWS